MTHIFLKCEVNYNIILKGIRDVEFKIARFLFASKTIHLNNTYLHIILLK